MLVVLVSVGWFCLAWSVFVNVGWPGWLCLAWLVVGRIDFGSPLVRSGWSCLVLNGLVGDCWRWLVLVRFSWLWLVLVGLICCGCFVGLLWLVWIVLVGFGLFVGWCWSGWLALIGFCLVG